MSKLVPGSGGQVGKQDPRVSITFFSNGSVKFRRKWERLGPR